MDIYKGKPELWNVLDETESNQQRVKMQQEIKDPRVVKQLYQQIDSFLEIQAEVIGKKQNEKLEVPIKTKYED